MASNGVYQNITRKIAAKTASYQVVAGDIGTLFTNRGASGAVTFTLPAVADVWTGWWCEVFAAAAQNVVVASAGSNDNLTTFNDLTADTITWSTSGEIVGASVRVTWDGTGWLCQLMTEETQTTSIS